LFSNSTTYLHVHNFTLSIGSGVIVLVFYLCKDDFSAAEATFVERDSCVA